jgi:UDP-glucose 4-epimerase
MMILAVGGSGFIGSYVVEQLLAAGHQVRAMSRGAPRYRQESPRLSLVTADVRDPHALRAALRGCDAVVHMASTTLPATGDINPKGDIADNLVATVDLLESMRDLGIRRLLYLSSGGAVYGVPEIVPIPETHPLRPINSYGIVKVAAESYIELFARSAGLSPVILRPSNPYGPRQGRKGLQGLVNTLMSHAIGGEPVQIWGDGSVVRDYLHVRDLARLCGLAIGSPVEGVFNAGSGQGTSVREMIELVSAATGRRIDAQFGPARAVDVPVSILDNAAAGRSFGWRPEIDLAEGLSSTWQWHLGQTEMA